MVRGISAVLGVGLVILWIVGLNEHATSWLTWLDGLGALCAFAIALAVPAGAPVGALFGSPLVLAIGLGVLWIIGLATAAVPWLTWWTFAFACAFLLLAIAAAGLRGTTTPGGREVRPVV